MLADEPRAAIAHRPRAEDVIYAFADFADLKAPHIRAHSRRTAELAEQLALALGGAESTVTEARHAALLHDLGLVAVPSQLLGKPEAALTQSERERLRLHPYHAERVLQRVPPLRHLAHTVGTHRERLDGTGYYRGLRGGEISLPARIVAVACEYDALTHDAPGRAAMPSTEAIEQLANHRGLARDVVRALTEALGARTGRTRSGGAWPAGLTDREVEVLRLSAGELTRRAIARRLRLSENTVRHHLEHIYTKTGTTTRVGAVLFAMEHGLLE
jgi:HD-GYP domain-containing protein (c-di-GMP phosphodiesterase class II)/DNA-binding CsgD family transcriptional regulator